jgi:hypothetical protein
MARHAVLRENRPDISVKFHAHSIFGKRAGNHDLHKNVTPNHHGLRHCFSMKMFSVKESKNL